MEQESGQEEEKSYARCPEVIVEILKGVSGFTIRNWGKYKKILFVVFKGCFFFPKNNLNNKGWIKKHNPEKPHQCTQ